VNLTRTRVALLACGVTLLLAAAPGASAKPGYLVLPGYYSVELNLKGSHGYRINIGKVGRRYVYLLASGERSVVAYTAPSLAPRGSEIKAKFPGLGRVSVRFRPQGPPRNSRAPVFPRCKGGKTVRQFGYFVGTIRFRGERGYTSARATRPKGVIETHEKEVCRGSMFDESPEPVADRTELHAISISGCRGAAFSASQHGDPVNLTFFDGTIAERRRGMTITRSIFVTGKASDITIGDTRPFPLSATITPPPPFSGSAEYQRTPGGDRTWTGSLTVPFPGLGRVSLAGPSFSALLCQHSGCHGPSVDGHSLPLTAHNPRSSLLSPAQLSCRFCKGRPYKSDTLAIE